MAHTTECIADRYRLRERLSSRETGIVWWAWDTWLQRPVVVKHPSSRADCEQDEAQQARDALLRETRITAGLAHPNVITVFDLVEHHGQPCIVLEYLPSRTLAACIAEPGPLSVAQAAAVGRQAAAGLAAAHRGRVVHGDVKPGNVLVTDTRLVKVTDFGAAHTLDDAAAARPGLIVGTPAYMAPEVARGSQASTASDVFALGATLYTAVQGHSPVAAEHPDDPLALLHAAAAEQLHPTDAAGPLSPVLDWALDPDPTARPSMDQLRTAMTGLVTTAETAAGQRPRAVHAAGPATDLDSESPSPPRRRARVPSGTLAAAVAAVVLALAGLIVPSVLNGSTDRAPQPQARPPVLASPAPAPTAEPAPDRRPSPRTSAQEPAVSPPASEVAAGRGGADTVATGPSREQRRPGASRILGSPGTGGRPDGAASAANPDESGFERSDGTNSMAEDLRRAARFVDSPEFDQARKQAGQNLREMWSQR